jgi:hypothetical protein
MSRSVLPSCLEEGSDVLTAMNVQDIEVDVDVEVGRWGLAVHHGDARIATTMRTSTTPLSACEDSPQPPIQKISYLPVRRQRSPSPAPPKPATPSQATTTLPPLPSRRLVPAALPPGFRIPPPSPPRLLPFPNQHQRCFSAPTPPLPTSNHGLREDKGEDSAAVLSFKHWLSSFSEHSIPLPFREVLA